MYVDAKILNVHDPSLKRRAFVGYMVEGDGRSGARESAALESDDAEVDAIRFAIEDLRGRYSKIVVVCDHESVVSEAVREDVVRPTESILELRQVLGENEWVELEVLKANPAHGVVTQFVNARLKEEQTRREGSG